MTPWRPWLHQCRVADGTPPWWMSPGCTDRDEWCAHDRDTWYFRAGWATPPGEPRCDCTRTRYIRRGMCEEWCVSGRECPVCEGWGVNGASTAAQRSASCAPAPTSVTAVYTRDARPHPPTPVTVVHSRDTYEPAERPRLPRSRVREIGRMIRRALDPRRDQ